MTGIRICCTFFNPAGVMMHSLTEHEHNVFQRRLISCIMAQETSCASTPSFSDRSTVTQ